MPHHSLVLLKSNDRCKCFVFLRCSRDELDSSSHSVSSEASPGNSNRGACSGNHGNSSYCLNDDSLDESVGSSAVRCQMMKVVNRS